MTAPLLSILPDLDATRGGVAAYALGLAARQTEGIAATHFVALRCPPTPPAPAATVVEPDGEALARTLARVGASRVLLHFSGYGFAPDACPQWLLDGLRRWRASQPHGRLVIYFHELITEEPWWTRTHWTQPRQKRIVDGLAALADGVATSCPYFAARLATRHGVDASRIVLAPVPPTLAEEGAAVAAPARSADGLSVLVFGLRGTRQRALREHARLLQQLLRQGRLSRLMLAGDGAHADEARALAAPAVRITAHPGLDPTGLRALAADADCGLVWNWAPILTKSTVFANLCALGVPAVISGRGGHDAGFEGEPAMIVGDNDRDEIDRAIRLLTDATQLDAVRARARGLADSHLSWSRTVTRIETLLRP